MKERKEVGESYIENNLIFPLGRLPSPKLYRMAKKTMELTENKSFNDSELEFRGGLTWENYQLFLDNVFRRYIVMEELKSNILKKTSEKIQTSSTALQDPIKSKGEKNVLVLLNQFANPENKPKTDPEYFQKLLFSNGNYNSMRNYFHEASWGQLNIQGLVTDWHTLEHNYDYYVDIHDYDSNTMDWKLPNAQKLVKEALIGAMDKVYDFSRYDNNGDGYIDILIVIYSGEGAHRTGNFKDMIYPHKGMLEDSVELQDGIKANKYILINELPADDLGGFCHEVSHMLGLPDLYLPDFTSTIVGKWCLMGRGDYNNEGKTPAHLSAWCKLYLGWVEPTLVNGGLKKYEIPYVINSEKKIFKIDLPGSDGKEYFLIENRQRIDFDKYLPGDGLLIWHINENNYLKRFPNLDPKHFFLTLKQADGKKELEKQIIGFEQSNLNKVQINDYFGDEGDVFPGDTNKRTFDGQSAPLSNSYDGKPSGIVIKSISDSDFIMSAVMGYETIKTRENTKDFEKGYKLGFNDGFQMVIEDQSKTL